MAIVREVAQVHNAVFDRARLDRARRDAQSEWAGKEFGEDGDDVDAEHELIEQTFRRINRYTPNLTFYTNDHAVVRNQHQPLPIATLYLERETLWPLGQRCHGSDLLA